jgi:hypothetical protein
MSANIKASVDGTQAIIGVGGVDQMTVSNAGVVTANSFVGAISAGNISSSTAIATGSTTARTLANRFADVVNVKDFGAVGDGVTDDTAAIQAAIDSLGTIGGIVQVPSGTYKVSSALNISSYINLKGSGAVSSTLLTNSSTNNVIYINGVSNSPGCTIEDLFFNSSVTRISGSYIVSNSSNGTFIKNCKMYSAFDGISITGTSAQNIKIEDCQIDNTINYGINITGFNNTSPNTTGIVVSYIARVLVTGAASPNNCNAGIRITSAGDLSLYGISTIYCKKGLDLSPIGTNTIQALNVTDSFFDTGDEFGISLNPASTASIRLANFTNVWCASNGMSGATLQGTGQIITTNWINCTMANNTGQGLWIASTLAKNTSIIGGVFAQNSQNGFGFAAGVSNFKIIGATIGRNDSSGIAFGPNGSYGINLPSGSSDNYIISNNIFTDNVLGGLVDGGSGINKTVYPNVGSGTAITPNANFYGDWGIDFAKQGAVAIANGTPHQLGAGSGLVLLHNNTTGDLAMFLCYGGTVTKVSGAASMVSGAAGANQIGLAYNGGSGKYEISNGYVAAQQINISTLKTRLAS